MNNNKNKLPVVFIILEILGPIVLIAGIAGLITFFITKSDIGHIGFTVSMICTPLGAILTFIGFIPLVTKAMYKAQHYVINDNKDTLIDIAEANADISGDAAKKVAQKVAEGFNDANEETIYCKYCGQPIDKDSKFCKYCGKEQ